MKFISAMKLGFSILLASTLFSVGSLQHAQTRRARRPLTRLSDVVLSVRFSPDGRTLAIARGARDSWQPNGRIELWDTETGKLRHVIRGFDGPVWSVWFAPAGKTLVSWSSEFRRARLQQKTTSRDGDRFIELRWWDVQTGELSRQLSLPAYDRIGVTAADSPDGKLIAAAASRFESTMTGLGLDAPIISTSFNVDVELLDAQTGEAKLRLKSALSGHDMIMSGNRTGRTRVAAGRFGARPAFSPDGQLIALWNEDELKLWDVQSAQQTQHFKKFKGDLGAVAFSPDGRLLALAITRPVKDDESHLESEIRLYDVTTGKLMRTLSVRTQMISSLVFSLRGTELLIGGWQREGEQTAGTLELFNLRTGSVDSVRIGETPIRTMVLSPNGRTLALQSDPSTVDLLDTQTWKVKHSFNENSDSSEKPKPFSRYLLSLKRVLALAFSPDGKSITGEVEQDGIKLWDSRTGEVKKQISDHANTPSIVEIASNGKKVAELGDNESVRLWDLTRDGTPIIADSGKPVSAIALSSDGQTLAIVHPNQVDLRNTSTGELLRTLEGQLTQVNCVTFSADGRMIATGADGKIEIWDLATGQTRKITNAGKVTALRFAPGGGTLASASEDGAVYLWDVKTVGLIMQLKKHEAAVNAIAFSPDGELMATGSDDRRVIIWDVASGKSRRMLKDHDLTVTSVAFSPNGSLLASGSGNASVVLWDVTTGKLNRVLR